MTTYYVRTDGNDALDGATDATAWATLGKLKTALDDGKIKLGDDIALRAGQEFFGSINTSMPDSALGLVLKIGAYGQGPRPIINRMKILNDPTVWTEHAAGVWKADLTLATGTFTGNRMTSNANIGFLTIGGVQHANKKMSLGAVASQWDFYSDSTHVYVKSTANPTTLTPDLRAAVDGVVIGITRNVHVSGLELKGSGGHGLRVTHWTNSSVVVSDCKIHQIGGSLLSGTTRYGNGIEIWVGGRNVFVEHNEIHDVYDVGVTYQGPTDGGSGLGFTNLHTRFNRIWNCNQTFEVWATNGTGSGANTNYGFVNCSFTDNICLNAGYSFGALVRSDNVGKGVHLLTYSMEVPTDIEVKRNVFWDARDAYAFANTNSNTLVAGFDTDENEVFLRPGTKVQWQSAQTVETASSWVTATGHDRGSHFYVIPDEISTTDEALAYLAGNSAFAQGQAQIQYRAIADLRGRVERVRTIADAAGARSVVLTPAPGFWEHDPGYAPLTATVVNGWVHLSGAIRRVSTSAALAMADGNAYGVTGAFPADMQAKARRMSSVTIFPTAATSGSIRGFIDVSNSWTELRVAAAGTPSITPGSGRIIFDGAMFPLA